MTIPVPKTEYTNATSFTAAFQTTSGQGHPLSECVSPLRRFIGFLDHQTGTYHYITVTNYKTTGGSPPPPGQPPWAHLTTNGGQHGTNLETRLRAEIEPLPLTILPTALRNGLEASELPQWVQDALYDLAAENGLLDKKEGE
jgi:hypothetical protein